MYRDIHIPLIHVSEVGDGDAEKRKQFVMQTGMLSSALEYATPEQMFASQDPAEPKPDAISAVKALQKASAAGQRIYHLTQDNMGNTLGAIHHDTATILEIRSALLAGKEVITHTNAVSVPGWSGAGYIILDPDTGVGAYKIAGGRNGGFLFWATVLMLALFFALAIISFNFVGAFFLALAISSFLERVEKIAKSNFTPEQMFAELNRAAAFALIMAIGGKSLAKLGDIGKLLVWYIRGFSFAFGKTWYG